MYLDNPHAGIVRYCFHSLYHDITPYFNYFFEFLSKVCMMNYDSSSPNKRKTGIDFTIRIPQTSVPCPTKIFGIFNVGKMITADKRYPYKANFSLIIKRLLKNGRSIPALGKNPLCFVLYFQRSRPSFSQIACNRKYSIISLQTLYFNRYISIMGILPDG